MQGCTDRRVALGIRRTRAAAAGAGGSWSQPGRAATPTSHPPSSPHRVGGGRAPPLGPVGPQGPQALELLPRSLLHEAARRSASLVKNGGPLIPRWAGPEDRTSYCGPEPARYPRRQGQSPTPPAAGHSPHASVGARDRSPHASAAARSPTVIHVAWGLRAAEGQQRSAQVLDRT